jgi:hypothetical protein
MKKFTVVLIFILLLSLSLIACSQQSELETTENTTVDTPTLAPPTDENSPLPADRQPGENTSAQLIQGTFALEDTDLAITAEQAKTLLPLWKAYKAVSESSTSSTVEQEALIQQISEAMTPEQLANIASMSFSPEEMAALMETLGIEGTTGMGRFGQNSDMTEEERESFMNSEEGQLLRDTMQGQGGGPGGGMGGGTGGVEMDPEQIATLQAEREANGGGFRANPMETILLDPLIELLSSKIS